MTTLDEYRLWLDIADEELAESIEKFRVSPHILLWPKRTSFEDMDLSKFKNNVTGETYGKTDRT